VLVVDASVIAPAVADGGTDGALYREAIRGHVLFASDLLRVEVLSVIRRHVTSGDLSKRQADNAVNDLLTLPVTPYDACYVALAEVLGAPLVTADTKLANAPGPRCEFRVL
jgi:predicted nucleic acid-binding protein